MRCKSRQKLQVILFEIDCAIFYTNLHELFCQFISWTNWVNSGNFMDNCWISCQVMADMKKVYVDLMIINLYIYCLERSEDQPNPNRPKFGSWGPNDTQNRVQIWISWVYWIHLFLSSTWPYSILDLFFDPKGPDPNNLLTWAVSSSDPFQDQAWPCFQNMMPCICPQIEIRTTFLRHSWGMREIQPCRAENNFPASCVN